MADQPVTIRQERIRQAIGRLAIEDMARLDVASAFIIGLTD
jgi:mRNA interferase MazF